MSKINLKESLKRLDIESDFEYSLTALYEACDLDKEDKEQLVKMISNPDPDLAIVNNMLAERAGLPDTICDDDLSDDEVADIRCEVVDEDFNFMDDDYLSDAIDDTMYYGEFLNSTWTDPHHVKRIGEGKFEVTHKTNGGKIIVEFDMTDRGSSILKMNINGDVFATKYPHEARKFIIKKLEDANFKQFDVDLDESLEEAIELTADEMKTKHGTDNPDIINAGKPEEERVSLKEDLSDSEMSSIVGNVARKVQQEVETAKDEIKQEIANLGKNSFDQHNFIYKTITQNGNKNESKSIKEDTDNWSFDRAIDWLTDIAVDEYLDYPSTEGAYRDAVGLALDHETLPAVLTTQDARKKVMQVAPKMVASKYGAKIHKNKDKSIKEAIDEFKVGDNVFVKPSKKFGRVTKVNGDYITVEVIGGKDPDRTDVYYNSDLELQESCDNLDEAWEQDYNLEEWNEEDIELHKSIDWQARNYRDYPVPEDNIIYTATAYGLPGGTQRKSVKFIKYIRPNPLFPPYYGVEKIPFEGVLSGMYDGDKKGKYMIMNRFETQEVYDLLSEGTEKTTKPSISYVLSKNMDKLANCVTPNEFRDTIIKLVTDAGVDPKEIQKLQRALYSKKSVGALWSTIGTYMTGIKVSDGDNWKDIKNESKSIEESYNIQFYQIFSNPEKPTDNGKMIAQAGTEDEAKAKGDKLVGKGNYLIKAVCDDGKVRDVDLYSYFNESKSIKDESIETSRESKSIDEPVEDELHENDSLEDGPYSASEVEKELKSLTQNFTISKDTLKSEFKEENDAAVEILKKHYNKVNSEQRGQWFEITFSEPKKINESYEYITSKSVTDSDGFITDYTMYKDNDTDKFVFVFGDKEIYTPEDGDFDWECDSEDEAYEWFDSYDGLFEDITDEDESETTVYTNEEFASSEQGMSSCKIWKDTNGIMGTPDEKYTLNDLADYWTYNNSSDPVLVAYKGNWKTWLDDTISQMEEITDYEESWTPNMTECPACGDASFDSKKGKCTKCSYTELLNENTDDDEGRMVGVAFNVNVPSGMTESEIEEIIRKVIGATDLDINSYMEIHTLDESVQEN